jgi:hypothetical protein
MGKHRELHASGKSVTLHLALLGGLLAAAGCQHGGTPQTSPLAPPPLSTGQPVRQPDQIVQAANPNAVARVEQAGQRLLQANPEIGLRPRFTVVGGGNLEITHHGVNKLVIAEALVNRCQTEGQLAALLSMELAQMAAELQQQRTTNEGHSHQDLAVMSPQIGPDRGTYEPWREAELDKQGYGRRASRAQVKPIDPILAARQYLYRAGYAEAELETINGLRNPHPQPPVVPAAHTKPQPG